MFTKHVLRFLNAQKRFKINRIKAKEVKPSENVNDPLHVFSITKQQTEAPYLT